MDYLSLNLPIEFKYNIDFSDQINDFLSSYKLFILDSYSELHISGTITDVDRITYEAELTKTIDLLNEFYERFDLGDNMVCYEKIKSLFVNVQHRLKSKEIYKNLPKLSSLYRMRPDSIPTLGIFNKKYDIFHIPFRLRHLVSTLRFNPPGIPCLYCSNELYTAYVEMRKDLKLFKVRDDKKIKNNALNCAKFKNNVDQTYIDFSLKDFDQLYKRSTTFPKSFINYSLLYPLISCLHIKQNFNPEQTVNFKMEYVLPSYIMTWLFNQNTTGYTFFGKIIEGICYSSTRASNPILNKNFAFPAKYSKSTNFCSKLESVFLFNYKYIYTDELYKVFNPTTRAPKKYILNKSEIESIESLF